MNVQIIFESSVSSQDAVYKMLTEDAIFETKEKANFLLKTLGSYIDRIETNEGTQKIYIKPLNNMLCG